MNQPPHARSPLVAIRDLAVTFGTAPALRGVDLDVPAGGAVGLVGESGSGKSVTWLAALGLLPGRARVSGSVRLAHHPLPSPPPLRGRGGAAATAGEGGGGHTELLGAPARVLEGVRGKRIAMIFQDPAASLNPVHRIGRQVAEAVRLHRGLAGAAARNEALRLLDRVGIPDARGRLNDYPHQLSGGQNQRVMIAIALAGEPALLVADEPTTALDATIQAQILDLLARLRRETGMALVLISHDLGVVAEACAQVAVMYAGRIVEHAPADRIFDAPAHPYTRGLLAALPDLDGPRRRLAAIPGTVPEPWNLPPGCAFAPRCAVAAPECATPPPFVAIAPGHFAACPRIDVAAALAREAA